MLKKIIQLLFLSFFLFNCSSDDIKVDPVIDNADTDVEELPELSPPNLDFQRIQNERLNSALSSDQNITTQIVVVLRDNQGVNINDAEVEILGVTKRSVNGKAIFNNVLLSNKFLAINISKFGFSEVVKTITVSNQSSYLLEVVLFESEKKTFDADKSTVLDFSNGIKIGFIENSLVDILGNEYKGVVNVNSYYHDPRSSTFVDSQPGTLVGLNVNNEISALKTFGMLTVDITNLDGEELYIKKDSKVSVEIPALQDSPETVPLWSLNEDFGIWVEEGVATKDNNIFKFEVNHFSSYNLDVFLNSVEQLNITVKGLRGQLLGNQDFDLFIDDNFVRNVITDNNGNFRLLYAPSGIYKIGFQDCENGRQFSNEINVTTSSDLELNFVDGVQKSKQLSFSGALLGCDSNRIGGEAFLFTLGEGGVFEKNVVIESSTNNTGFNQGFESFSQDGRYFFDVNICGFESGFLPLKITRIATGETLESQVDLNRSFLSSNYKICDDADTSGEVLIFEDQNLESFIKLELGIAPNEDVLVSDVAQLTKLTITESITPESIITNTSDLRFFENLEELRFPVDSFVDLSALVNLTNLHTLSLTNIRTLDATVLYNGIDLDIESILQINNLENLRLNGFQIPFIPRLDSLKKLSLIHCDVSQSDTIGIESRLEDFEMLFTETPNLFFLLEFNNLKKFSIRTTNNSGISNVDFLANKLLLEEVSISSNEIRNIDALNNLLNLRKVTLRGVFDLSGLSRLTNLNELNFLGNVQFDFSIFSQFTNLERLRVSSRNIDSTLPFRNLTNLLELNLRFNTRLTTSDIDELRQFLPNTEIIF